MDLANSRTWRTAMPPSNPLTTSHWLADTSQPLLETTVGSVLREAAERAPDTIALIAGSPDPALRTRWRYGELLAEAERAASALLARFNPGEPVAVYAGNVPEWVVMEFAAGLAGVTLVTVNPASQPAELEHVLADSRARGIFLGTEHRGASLAATLDQVRPHLPELRHAISFEEWPEFCRSGATSRRLPDVDPAAPAQIIYTSGTTGRPKGAVLTHRALTNNARLALQTVGPEPGEVAVNPMPLFHVAGCCMLTLGIVQTLGTHVLPPRFDPGLQLELIESYRGALIGGVSTMLMALLEHRDAGRRDLSSLRWALSGGALVPPELARRVEAAFGVPLVITFAQTESSCSITMTRSKDSAEDRAQSVGRPLPQTEVRIVDPVSAATVPPGTVGEICTRGYLVMRGYLDDPASTRAAIDEDGWLHTGDLGSMDERGYVRIEGRLKDMIIRGGENIYPREIEAVILSHPQVAEVAVVGVDDRFWGEEVAAVVRPVGGQPPPEAELVALCRERLAHFKVPSRWAFVEAFPLTASGKVQKNVLRERLASALNGAAEGDAATEDRPGAHGGDR
jgi:fatty-acyl-CoA synthase